MKRLRNLLLAGCLLVACSVEAAGPKWVDLTRGFDPCAVLEQVPSGPWEGQITVGSPFLDRRGFWVHSEATSSEWESLGHGFWRLQRERSLEGEVYEATLPSLLCEDRSIEPLGGANVAYWGAALENYGTDNLPVEYRKIAQNLPAFALGRNWVYWLGEPGGAGPGDTRLSTWLDLGSRLEVEPRVELGSLSCLGFPLLTGIPQTLEIPGPGLTRLKFATVTWAGKRSREVTFALYCEDREIWRFSQSAVGAERIEFHSLRLPHAVRAGTKLRFEAYGSEVITAILTPRIYSDEWAWQRRTPPNLIMYTAGSFRADNLKALGGEELIAPNLDALAEEGLCFSQAYTPATHPLLANAATASGMYPSQILMSNHTSVLPSRVVTLAEHLRSQGYRTVAITDGGAASRRFGLAQGFEWFEENQEGRGDPTASQHKERWPMLDSVERILSSSDGRPLFLYVHSKRLSWPYRVSGRLSGETQSRASDPGALQKSRTRTAQSIEPGMLRRRVPRAEAVNSYRGASVDADYSFGEFRSVVESFGALQESFLVFLGDRGESFGAHPGRQHGRGVWQSEARIPLIIKGPDSNPKVKRRIVSHPVSLVSLARTLVELLGVTPLEDFSGPSLLAGDSGQGIFVFHGLAGPIQGQVAVVLGCHKGIFGWESGSTEIKAPVGFFNVILDPGEGSPLAVDSKFARDLTVYLRECLPYLMLSFEGSKRSVSSRR